MVSLQQSARVLLLAPALSSDQILEAAIVKIYVRKACERLFKHVDIAASWELPPVELTTGSLQGRLLGSDDFGRQTVLLSIATSASLVEELERSDVVVVCLNGPVPNPGICALAVLASAANRAVVYWKDDVRKLWGIEDDPLTIGLLPAASSRLTAQGPPVSLTRLSHLTEGSGQNSFETLIAAALKQPKGPATELPGSYVRNLVTIGAALRLAKTYAQIRQVVMRHSALLDAQDIAFLR